MLRQINEFNQMLLDFSAETINDAIAEESNTFYAMVEALKDASEGNYVPYNLIKAGYYNK